MGYININRFTKAIVFKNTSDINQSCGRHRFVLLRNNCSSSNKLKSCRCADEVDISQYDVMLDTCPTIDESGNAIIDISSITNQLRNGYYEGFFIIGCDVSNTLKFYFGVNLVMDIDRLITRECIGDNSGCMPAPLVEHCCTMLGQQYVVQSVVKNVMTLRLANDVAYQARANTPTNGRLAFDNSNPDHIRLVDKCNHFC